MKNNRKHSVIGRINSGFIIIVILFAATVILMLNGLSRINNQFQSVTTDVLLLIFQANQTSVKLRAADKIFKDTLILQDPALIQTNKQLFSQSHKVFNKARNQLSGILSTKIQQNQLLRLQTLEDKYFAKALLAMEDYQELLVAQQEQKKAIRKFHRGHATLSVKMKKYIYSQNKNRLDTNIIDLTKEVDMAMVLLDSFRDAAKQDMDKAITSADNIYAQINTQAIALSLTVVILALFIGWRITIAVRHPLLTTLGVLEELTNGDMTQRINHNTFTEFNQLNSHINTLAQQQQNILCLLAQASGDLAEVATKNKTITTNSKIRLKEHNPR